MMKNFKDGLVCCWNNGYPTIESDDRQSAVDRWSPIQERVAAIVIAVASLVVLAPSLSYPLIAPDETRYAQIAMEMIESRDWITPTLDGQPYLDKPPLMYWLTAISFQICGQSEWAARLPSMLSALSTVMVVLLLGRQIVGSQAAFLGSASLLLCGGFLLAGRFLILDSLLSFWTTCCLLVGCIAAGRRNRRCWWWLLAGLACGMGILTKGPIALVLCGPPLAIGVWMHKERIQPRIWDWGPMAILMTLLCVPWYLAVWKFNPDFGDYFFLEHNVKRFTEGSNHRQPFWFYIPILMAAMFPTSLLLPSLGVFLFSPEERCRRGKPTQLRFLCVTAAWILAFFSAASCKLPTYIIPVIPIISLILGVILSTTVFASESTSRITRYLRPFPLRANLILLIAGATVLGTQIWLEQSASWSVITTMLLGAVILAVTVRCWNQPAANGRLGWVTTALLAIAVLSTAGTGLLPAIASERSVYSKTAALAHDHPDRWIVFFGEKRHAVKLQIRADRVVYFSEQQKEEFATFLVNHADTIVVANERSLPSTREAIAATHVIQATGAHKRLYLASPRASTSVAAVIANTEHPIGSELR
ncbi:Undecaprenyl phosphate-alpha-4-amino-4-deoxy-L-arabinose arabinosyl transferase [Rubripirellula lacrimiformis]|uniref:Undecaprenyl phosphate-alpha-4-amino-4-deoxy-L-arabinose arabinosyl transferase n=1 Tax=Rubripirellula lacrimiformis TaxID=1930273 RepID=A0A517NFK9_9BACT|nr:phospholipid carrier-dependent glycosyltransferase [Rubripirellula lacrimiformis]QDT05913.1 Undecaprenyl phosphate-alpha-4-amino-4-deoxy-L-arabinose arabinosyl transferase [Rubripirellula lacrimiformis]